MLICTLMFHCVVLIYYHLNWLCRQNRHLQSHSLQTKQKQKMNNLTKLYNAFLLLWKTFCPLAACADALLVYMKCIPFNCHSTIPLSFCVAYILTLSSVNMNNPEESSCCRFAKANRDHIKTNKQANKTIPTIWYDQATTSQWWVLHCFLPEDPTTEATGSRAVMILDRTERPRYSVMILYTQQNPVLPVLPLFTTATIFKRFCSGT